VANFQGGNRVVERKFKVLKAKSKDYGKKFHTDDISSMRSPHVGFLALTMPALGSDLLLADNRVAFKDILGKPSFHFRGSEFYFHCWLLELTDSGLAHVLILTAKGKGTCYEIVREIDGGRVRRDEGTIGDFLVWLEQELRARNG
jgi:hypothetical protein